jgi:RHS repeat-associated protein
MEKNVHSTNGGVSFLQSIDMRYNIRGWITNINNSALTNDGLMNNDAGDLFGMELLYNTSPVTIADGNNGSFVTRKMYGGNISAIKWKSDLRDGSLSPSRIYGFNYDQLNRFRNAYFATSNSGIWNGSPGFFNESVTRYDANGNIGGETSGTNSPALSRTGFLNGSKVNFDNLAYRYVGNQLKNVVDASNHSSGFTDKAGIPVTTDEFIYDENGNLKENLNRSISKITYNHLNLPVSLEITRMDNKIDRIEFVYDATGNKLSRSVYVSGTSSSLGSLVWKTDFVGGMQYDNGNLSFLKTPEGRAVWNGNEFDYEYFYNDHQGNVRLVYGALKETLSFKATMEPELASLEEDPVKGFGNVAQRRITSPNPVLNYTSPFEKVLVPDHSARCNAMENRAVGPAKALKVSSGDAIYMEVFAQYTDHLSNGHGSIPSATLGTAVNLALGISPVTEATLYSGVQANVATAAGTVPSGTTRPKGYLVFLFFDDNYVFQRAGAMGLTSYAYNAFEKLSRSFTADKNGYLYIYTATESNTAAANVYFDDMYVIHQKTNDLLQVTQASDYYPFGPAFNEYNKDRLRVVGTSQEKMYEPILRNRYRFQGQEMQRDLNLGWYQYKYRMHDPAMGRFSTVDPLAEEYWHNSTYAFSENRLTDGIELEGKELSKMLFETAKYISPIAFKIDFHMGSHKMGIGYEISIGLPKAMPFSYRKGYGETFYAHDIIQGKAVSEKRTSTETSYFGLLSTQSINYQSGETSQTVGMVTIGTPIMNIEYGNDWFSPGMASVLDPFNFHPPALGDAGDRFRTAALRINVGPLNAGFNLATGDPGPEGQKQMERNGGFNYYIFNKDFQLDPNKYRLGAGYVGFGGLRIGVDNEYIRHMIQNRLTHDNLGIPRFVILPSNNQFFFQYSTGTNGLW